MFTSRTNTLTTIHAVLVDPEADYLEWWDFTGMTTRQLDELIALFGEYVAHGKTHNHRGYELDSVRVLHLLSLRKEGVGNAQEVHG